MAHCGAKFQNLGGGQGNDDRGEERRVFGRGRGRGRWLNRRVNGSDEADEFQQRVVGTYDSKIYNAVMRGDTEAVKEALLKDVGQCGEVPSYFKHYESMMSGTDSVSEDAPKKVDVKSTPPARTAPKKAATKTNGYCLFIKHMGRKTNTTGSINELMAMFDKDWKSLPEEEKRMWKERAKSGWKPDFRKNDDGKSHGRGSDRTPSTSHGAAQKQTNQPKKDYDTGEEDDDYY